MFLVAGVHRRKVVEMAVKVYSGKSSGFNVLVDGYFEYAQEVVAKRAFPDMRDGLKPVQRRILHAFGSTKEFQKGFVKSARIVGDVMGKYHPHGDAAIYDAMVRMVHSNESFCMPLLKGRGNLGHVTSDKSPAASRYTEVAYTDFAGDFFGYGSSAVEWVSTELEDGSTEPSVLAVNYPFVLTVGSSGLGVGASTRVLPFNFWDVLDLLEKRVNGHELTEEDIIYPDFSSGGLIVEDRKEAYRLMRSGKGTVKVRSEIEVDGKELLVKSLPPEITIEKALAKINRLNEENRISGIKSAYDSSGFESPSLITIECTNKQVIDDVIVNLYRHKVLQGTASSNMVLINDGKPFMGGVFSVIDEWLNWRRDVLTTAVQNDLNDVTAELDRLHYFIELVRDAESKATFLDKLTTVSKSAAVQYLSEKFEGIPEDVSDWITSRRASAFLNGDTYANRYDGLLVTRDELSADLADINRVIIRDIADLRRKHDGHHKRRTVTTNRDYRFNKAQQGTASERVTDTRTAFYTVYTNGFIKKTSAPVVKHGVGRNKATVMTEFVARADSTIIGFDSTGRIIRVYGEDLGWTMPDAPGTYVFNYLEDDDNIERTLLWAAEMDGSSYMLLFADGKISWLDTSKWVGVKSRHKIVNNGVAQEVENLLLDVIPESKVPEVMLCVDAFREGKARIGTFRPGSLRRGSSAKSRIKALGGSGGVGILLWGGVPSDYADTWVDEAEKYDGRVRTLPGQGTFENIMDGLDEVDTEYVHEDLDLFDILNEPTFSTVL